MISFNNKQFFILLGLGGVAVFYVLHKLGKLPEAAGKFFDALTFDPASLGPSIGLTQGATTAADDYIRLGYATKDANGVITITPKGQAWIDSQAGH